MHAVKYAKLWNPAEEDISLLGAIGDLMGFAGANGCACTFHGYRNSRRPSESILEDLPDCARFLGVCTPNVLRAHGRLPGLQGVPEL